MGTNQPPDFETIWFSARGTVHIAGLDDGNEIVLRFRSHEIAMLEGRRGRGILSLLNEESLGVSFLRDALIVGAAHQFVGKKGKAKKALTEALASRWIDRCEDNGVPFEDLLQGVVKAVVGGLPGGHKYLEAMDGDDDDKASEDADGNPPLPSAA